MEGGPWMIVKGLFVHGPCSTDRPCIPKTLGTPHFQRAPKQRKHEQPNWGRVRILELMGPIGLVQIPF